MVHELEARGINSPRVLEAFRQVPRHLFVPEALRNRAYGDHPLPIGEGQTITQPFTIACAATALELTGQERVLEIGTGSGYQAAILARLTTQVFTVERHPSLASRARAVLESLGIQNVLVHTGDGSIGWSRFAPYDGIVVAAAAPSVPSALLAQVREGGSLIIPIGDVQTQRLVAVHKRGGECRMKTLIECHFVPLVGREGWSESVEGN